MLFVVNKIDCFNDFDYYNSVADVEFNRDSLSGEMCV